MPFDAEGARKAGYSDAEIAGFLKDKIDVEGARKAGYSDKEIVNHFAGAVTAPPPPPPQKTFPQGAPVDVAKQGGAGLVEGLVGLPGAAARMAQSAGETVQPYLEKAGLVSPAAEASRQGLRAQIDALPGSPAAMEKALASVLPGDAETGPGRYARAALRMVPGAVLGMKGSIPGAVATGVGAGVGSEAAGQAAEGTGYEGLARFGGGLVGGGITAAAAAKLTQDAARTAVATSTAPQAAAASGNGPLAAALHSPIADVAAHAGGPKGSMLLAAARKMVGKPAVEAPPPVPTEPWQTPGLPAPGVETGPWGPWANAKSPTGTGLPTKPWSTPQLEDVMPTMADLKGLAKIGRAQQKQQVADTMPLLRELAVGSKERAAKEATHNAQTVSEAEPLLQQLSRMPTGPSSPFPGPQPGPTIPMGTSLKPWDTPQLTDITPPRAFASTAVPKDAVAQAKILFKGLQNNAKMRAAAEPPVQLVPPATPAPQPAPPAAASQAMPAPAPVVTAKAITKVNGKVKTTPNEAPPVDDGIPDFLRRTPKAAPDVAPPPAPAPADLHYAVAANVGNPQGLRDFVAKHGFTDQQVKAMIEGTYDHAATANKAFDRFAATKPSGSTTPPEPALTAPIADTSVMNQANWGTHTAVDAGLLGKYTEAGQHIAENYKNSPNFKGFKTSEQHFGEEVLPPMLEAKHQAAQKLVDVLPTKGSADQLAAHLWGLGRNSAKEFKANLIKEYPQFQAQINNALPDLLMRYWSGGKPKHLQIR